VKTMTVFEARNHFARMLEVAKDDVVIVTRNGKPVATVQAIDDDDIEDLLLERSDRFWEMIARARRGKPVALETLRRQVRPKGSSGKIGRPRAGARRSAGAPRS
jgi:prevent-host-death family protein